MQKENLSLKQIIENCANPKNVLWQEAWTEFLVRYKQLLYYFIKRSCESWNSQRLNIQLKESVNDIFSEVIVIIFKNIHSFENRDSDQKFISWLQVICNRSTTAFIQRKLKNILNEDEFSEFSGFRKSHSVTKLWELYETIISMLRNNLRGNKNMERDINIFMLRVWGGFSTKQIMEHPYYQNLNESSINVIIARVRKNFNRMGV